MWVKTGQISAKNSFLKLRSQTRNESRKMRRDFFNIAFQASIGDSKKFPTVNRIMNTASSRPPIKAIYYDDEVVSDPSLLVSHFNRYFAEVGKRLSESTPPVTNTFANIIEPGNSFVFQRRHSV